LRKKKIKGKYHFRVSLIVFFLILLCKQLEKKIFLKNINEKGRMSIWRCGSNYFLKYFLLKNILKYIFLFFKLFFLVTHQNNLITLKKIKK
jgi:hypothetical protein